MQDCCRKISPACIGRELLPFQLSTVYVCTTWLLDPKALAMLPGFCIAVHLLSVLKHGWCKASPVCCHENAQASSSKKLHEQHVFLSLNKVGVEAPCTSLDELMFDYLAFDAAGAAGTAPGGTSGEQAYFACIYIVLHLFAPPA
jgi:hypothetical protein